MIISDRTEQAILDHARQECPRESCGVVIVHKGKDRYIPCRNISTENEHFTIHPGDWAAAVDGGNLIAVVHSHCTTPPIPTTPDLVMCEATDRQHPGLTWIIVNPFTRQFHEFKPSGYKAPLEGREFVHGVSDCYALIRDYFLQELNIVLPDFERADEWWLKKGVNLYLRNFEAAGFIAVPPETLQQHDGIIMQIGDAEDPNHAAVYLGNHRILHHTIGRLSCYEVYGGYWQKHTISVVRHRSQL